MMQFQNKQVSGSKQPRLIEDDMAGKIGCDVRSDAWTSDELAMWDRDGFLIARDFANSGMRQRMLDVTLRGLHLEIEPLEYESELHYPGAPASRDVEGGKTVRRLKQALSRDYVFTEWVQQPQLVERLRQLLGPDVVCPLAHHNCVMTKEPRFSSDTGWHQDIRYWSFQRPELVSVWVALGQETQENGCLQLVPGSHRLAFRREQFDNDLFFRSDYEENQELLQQKIYAELAPGDVLFFHCKTLHAATRNHTPHTKYAFVTTYRSLDNPPLPESRSSKSPELLLH